MKLFLAIAITLGGIVLLFAAAVNTVNYSGFNDDALNSEAIFGVAFLAAGIAWLWKQRAQHSQKLEFKVTAKSNLPPSPLP